jgi:hypothetical protein
MDAGTFNTARFAERVDERHRKRYGIRLQVWMSWVDARQSCQPSAEEVARVLGPRVTLSERDVDGWRWALEGYSRDTIRLVLRRFLPAASPSAILPEGEAWAGSGAPDEATVRDLGAQLSAAVDARLALDKLARTAASVAGEIRSEEVGRAMGLVNFAERLAVLEADVLAAIREGAADLEARHPDSETYIGGSPVGADVMRLARQVAAADLTAEGFEVDRGGFPGSNDVERLQELTRKALGLGRGW